MKTLASFVAAVAAILCPLPSTGAEPVSASEEQLRLGLFEEEANRDLDKAEQHYQALVEAHQRDRPLAATALFRLGEIARKRDRRETAIGHYRTLVEQFPEATELVRLAHQNLAGLGAAAPESTAPALAAPGEAEQLELARLQRLLQESPDLVDGPDEQGWSPLHHAAKNGWSRAVAFLLARGVAVDSRTVDEGFTASHLAAMHGHLATLRRLLDAGAVRTATFRLARAVGALPTVPGGLDRPDGSDFPGDWSLLDLAIVYDRSAIVDLLLAGDREQSAILLGRTGPVLHSVSIGVISPDRIPLTPVMLALWLGRESIATTLVERGAALAPIGGDDAVSALLFASYWRPEFALTLLEHGADPKLGHPASGTTPLHVAIHSNKLDLARALLDAGAAPDAATTAGRTPLHYARTPAAVALLLDQRVDINAADSTAMTPLEALCSSRSDDDARAAFRLLLENGATCTDTRRLVSNARTLLPDALEHFVYPQALAPDGIRVVSRETRGWPEPARVIEARPNDAARPPPLADVLAIYCCMRSRMTGGLREDRFGSLRVLRRAADGSVETVFSAVGPEVAAAGFPALAWGDLVEVNVLLGGDGGIPAGSPGHDELLSRRVAPRRVAFRLGTFLPVLDIPGDALASPFNNAELDRWRQIDLHNLLEATFKGCEPGIQTTPVTIQREGVEQPYSFQLSQDWEFRLAGRDIVTLPLPSAGECAYLVRMPGALRPTRIDDLDRRPLLDVLWAYGRQGSDQDWRNLEIHHANLAGVLRPFDVDRLLRSLPRDQWSKERWNELDYSIRPGTIIVIPRLAGEPDPAEVKRSAETARLLGEIQRFRDRDRPGHADAIPGLPRVR